MRRTGGLQDVMPCSRPIATALVIWQQPHQGMARLPDYLRRSALRHSSSSSMRTSSGSLSRHNSSRGRRVSAAIDPDSADGQDTSWENMPKYTVSMEKRDFPLETWLQRLKDKRVNLDPEYQRPFVWDQRIASRLVAHTISGLTVQPVLLHEQSGGRYDVVDGKQRMVVLLSFLMGGNSAFPEAPWLSDFRLQIDDDDELQPWLDGKRFSDLPQRIKDELLNFNLSANIMKMSSDLDAVYRQYEGINQGSKKHSKHQLRKVAYRGDYIRLIDGLGKGAKVRADDTTAEVWQRMQPQLANRFNDLIGFTALEKDEEEDLELVLRFFAMRRSFKAFKQPMKDFLNRELQELSSSGVKQRRELAPAELARMGRDFASTVELAHAALRLHERDAAFALIPPDSKKKPAKLLSSPAVYDTFMPGLCEALEAQGFRMTVFKKQADAILKGMAALLNDARWRACCKTTTAANLRERAKLFADMMQEAVLSEAPVPQQRSFSKSDKQRLVQAARAGAGGSAPGVGRTVPPGDGEGGGKVDAGAESSGAGCAAAAEGPAGKASEPAATHSASGSQAWGASDEQATAGGMQCLWCGEAIVHESHAQVDHKRPWARGGPTSLDNAALLHELCNKQKGARLELWQGPYAARLSRAGLPLPPDLQPPAGL